MPQPPQRFVVPRQPRRKRHVPGHVRDSRHHEFSQCWWQHGGVVKEPLEFVVIRSAGLELCGAGTEESDPRRRAYRRWRRGEVTGIPRAQVTQVGRPCVRVRVDDPLAERNARVAVRTGDDELVHVVCLSSAEAEPAGAEEVGSHNHQAALAWRRPCGRAKTRRHDHVAQHHGGDGVARFAPPAGSLPSERRDDARLDPETVPVRGVERQCGDNGFAVSLSHFEVVHAANLWLHVSAPLQRASGDIAPPRYHTRHSGRRQTFGRRHDGNVSPGDGQHTWHGLQR
mmetsp:Transcript_30999/g.95746  ORF Transcript_30999/g.95746 Transcript_30999/m.95746 type:complete len:284 (+) Transcript_30999:1110-1961(+)